MSAKAMSSAQTEDEKWQFADSFSDCGCIGVLSVSDACLARTEAERRQPVSEKAEGFRACTAKQSGVRYKIMRRELWRALI